ncbi:hypothetical protein D9615_007093 [Tricholomella constricta]|uniref:Uncharacterized protein n=1 Tax=Tricholomella constricta TaxID=117010 RepID=A0A8H5H8H5_9AGAR|nr:hypothetical protein D9615_007093 [Tricholomella constricta]
MCPRHLAAAMHLQIAFLAVKLDIRPSADRFEAPVKGVEWCPLQCLSTSRDTKFDILSSGKECGVVRSTTCVHASPRSPYILHLHPLLPNSIFGVPPIAIEDLIKGAGWCPLQRPSPI